VLSASADTATSRARRHPSRRHPARWELSWWRPPPHRLSTPPALHLTGSTPHWLSTPSALYGIGGTFHKKIPPSVPTEMIRSSSGEIRTLETEPEWPSPT